MKVRPDVYLDVRRPEWKAAEKAGGVVFDLKEWAVIVDDRLTALIEPLRRAVLEKA